MIDPEGFERLYRADPDPFRVATSWYERRKQAALVAALTQERYPLVWDCAAGTGLLALALLTNERCERLLATDASPTAVRLTAQLLEDLPGAHSVESTLPSIPEAARAADLTIAAEVLYYLADGPRCEAMQALARQHGELVSVHWRHHPDDAHLSGVEVTAELDDTLRWSGCTRSVHQEDTDFVLAGCVAGTAR
ncbi:MAG: hypothetical protein JWO46_374 [Nocardioidaceae bacterium]|nr:hypothetical protein [Nocardioidaceae bacterium]